MRPRFGGKLARKRPTSLSRVGKPLSSLCILATSCLVTFFSNIPFCSKEFCFCRGPALNSLPCRPPFAYEGGRTMQSVGRFVSYFPRRRPCASTIFASITLKRRDAFYRSKDVRDAPRRSCGPATAGTRPLQTDLYSARDCAVLGD